LLAVYLDSAALSDLMAKMMARRSLLSGIFARRGDQDAAADGTITALYAGMGLTRETTAQDVLRAACRMDATHEAALKRAMQALLSGSKTDRDKGEAMAAWLAAD